MKQEYSILSLCEAFGVSPSGYYGWLKRQTQPGTRALEDQALSQQIADIHLQSRKTYGSPRVQAKLRQKGQHHGRNRIRRLMRQQDLCGRQKARYRGVTTDSHHDQPIAPNLLAQAPKPSGPNQIWVADVTYIKTQSGWLFLAAILDLYSRRIVGWSMSQRNDTALVLNALTLALLQRNPPAQLLFHSDRGIQYAASHYRRALSQAGLIASMSPKGNCYDNATMESFWSTLKLELIYRLELADPAQARAEIFSFIEAFYNRQRIYSALGYLSPVDFETNNN